MDKDTHQQQHVYQAPGKAGRFEGYMNSNGMTDTLRNYKDNDITYGQVDGKNTTQGHNFQYSNNREWAPKAYQPRAQSGNQMFFV